MPNPFTLKDYRDPSVHAQAGSAIASETTKPYLALGASAIGGAGLLYLLKKHLDTYRLAPDKNRSFKNNVMDSDSIPLAEKLSDFNSGSILGGAVEGLSGAANQALGNDGIANNSGNSLKMLALAGGIPTAIFGTLALKNLIDKSYKIPNSRQKELDQASSEYADLMSNQGNFGSPKMASVNAYLEALEDHIIDKTSHFNLSEKSANLYSWLPALALGVGIPTAYMKAKSMIDNDPAVIKRKASEDAVRRMRMLNPPKMNVVIANTPEEYEELNRLDNTSRNLIPILRPQSNSGVGNSNSPHGDSSDDIFNKLSHVINPAIRNEVDVLEKRANLYGTSLKECREFWKQASPIVKRSLIKIAEGFNMQEAFANVSPEQMARTLSAMPPETIGYYLNHLRQTNPAALEQLGGAHLPDQQIMGNLNGMLTQHNWWDPMGWKNGYVKSQLLHGLGQMNQSNQGQPQPQMPTQPGPYQGPDGPMGPQQQPPRHNAAINFMGNLNPWQIGIAAGAGGLGLMTGHPILGLMGAGAALGGPALWKKYVDSRMTSDPSKMTGWMNSYMKRTPEGPMGPQPLPAAMPNHSMSNTPSPMSHAAA